MNYPMRVFTVKTTSGFEWVAEFVDFIGCVGGGDTAKEAVDAALTNLEVYLQYLKEEGEDIPQPSDYNECNGKIALRIPKSMHRRLVMIAQEEGVSLNQLILSYLAEMLGAKSKNTSKT